MSAVPAPPERLPRRVAAMTEQVCVSGAHFIAFILFARALAPSSWGEFGFAYALVLFLQGFQRALVTIPMIPFSAGTAGPAGAGGWDRQREGWAGANMLLALAGSLLLAAAAALAAVLSMAWLSRSLLMATVMALPLMVHEFTRRAAVQEGRWDLLAGMGAVYALLLGSAAVLPAGDALRPWLPSAGVAAAALSAALLYRGVAGRPALPRPAWPGAHAGYPAFAGWASLGHLGYSGYNFGVQSVLAAVAGPAAVGAFHACRTLVQPVSVLMGAMDSIDKPRAAAALVAAGPAGLRRVLRHSLLLMAAFALPYLALVTAGAGPLLALAYGERYAGQQDLVLMWCLVALCSVVSMPVESGLYVARRTRTMFFGRAAAAALALAAAVPLVQAHGAVGALAAMALGFAVAALCGALSLRRLASTP